jgi:hypothetical protein
MWYKMGIESRKREGKKYLEIFIGLYYNILNSN